MESKKLEIADFKDFEENFKKIKEEIQDKFIVNPIAEISEDIIKGFQKYIEFLNQKLIKAGRKPDKIIVSQ